MTALKRMKHVAAANHFFEAEEGVARDQHGGDHLEIARFLVHQHQWQGQQEDKQQRPQVDRVRVWKRRPGKMCSSATGLPSRCENKVRCSAKSRSRSRQ